jgi:predicted  nucleic acid-binding Zn-ribbon protein
LRDAPDVIYEGGSGSFVDDDLARDLEAAEREAGRLRDEVDELSGKVEDAETDIEDLREAMIDAIEAIKNGHADDALKILGKAVDG